MIFFARSRCKVLPLQRAARELVLHLEYQLRHRVVSQPCKKFRQIVIFEHKVRIEETQRLRHLLAPPPDVLALDHRLLQLTSRQVVLPQLLVQVTTRDAPPRSRSHVPSASQHAGQKLNRCCLS